MEEEESDEGPVGLDKQAAGDKGNRCFFQFNSEFLTLIRLILENCSRNIIYFLD